MTPARRGVPKLARATPRRLLAHLLALLEALERDWEDPPRRGRALESARRLLRELEGAGAALPPGARDLGRRLAREPGRHELPALIVPLERALDRGVRDEDFLPATDAPAPRAAPMPVRIVADSLRSAFNVGGVFRSAECFGAEAIVLTGYSADPGDARVARAAMGTDRRVAWSRRRSAAEALAGLREEGVFALALESDAGCAPLADVAVSFPCAVLVGNERFGLSPGALAAADARVRIPTFGAKASLNVVAALAIALYELRRRFDAVGEPQASGVRKAKVPACARTSRPPRRSR
jgi:23S rRNA (guanosine2251-2'-O)-methyltransferase